MNEKDKDKEKEKEEEEEEEEKEEEEEEEEEKIPLCESIGHRPLRGRCPAPTLYYNLDLPKQGTGTADHLTLLRLFNLNQCIPNFSLSIKKIIESVLFSIDIR